MKEDYSGQICTICGSAADGLHYGAISCRSCNAFFRRTVVEKSKYQCKGNGNCTIDMELRCACRSCRFRKCLEAGMKTTAVQPRRDPTGAQRDRKKRFEVFPSTSYKETEGSDFCPETPRSSEVPEFRSPKNRRLSDSPRSLGVNNENKPSDGEDTDDDQFASTSNEQIYGTVSPMYNETDRCEFRDLVNAFADHQRMMQLSFSTIDQFLTELENGPVLRPMVPTDVEKLSEVELTGLFFWIEKLRPYSDLPPEDKSNLLKRYSVRKLSLDHFYSASKNAYHCKRGEFVMNNYTYVQYGKTGFEMPHDDFQQISAKKYAFTHTFQRFWTNVIFPFMQLRVTDAEITYLQMMLLWSQSNSEHVTPQTREIMKERRNWCMRCLFDWYVEHRFEDPGLRFGQMTLMIGEIETICEMHCQDFLVAKLFDFCDMGDCWYESLCYTSINTNTLYYDPNLFENLKRFTAMKAVDCCPINAFHHLRVKNEQMEAFSRLAYSPLQRVPEEY
ncbi:unnamed protein product [Caenorhabditis auriculariae]|uniref:Nuclear receptor domain-containing protein n=1 Tax=Caenorhabditis auriculariae TaxID=2777116 RepID=A0A8S1GUM4_9PELO|nr:unnamed protein product [Caenorhabditis auriculariae]